MTQNRPPKPSKIDPKTGPESNIVFLTMFYQSWAPQNLENIKKPKENLCFSRVRLFRIDHDFDQNNLQK